MSLSITNELKRLKNLKQNQDKSDADLMKQAQVNLARKRFSIDDRFIDKAETKTAQELFDSYVAYYGFQKLTDLESLGDLIYEEMLKRRIQKHLNTLNEKSKDTYITKNDLQGLHDVEARIWELKIKLGIDSEDKQDELSALQLAKKRFHNYIQEHKNEFTTACKSCGTLLLLRKRITDFDCLTHPWYAGRWLFNYEILSDVKKGKISKEDAWRYLCCASKGGNYEPAFSKKYCTDYIDWCFENWDIIMERFEANQLK